MTGGRSRCPAVIAVLLLFLVVLASLQAQQKGNSEGYVGVSLANVPPADAADFGVKGPAVGAARVAPDSPAYKSGLRQGDLITSIDGQKVTDANQAFVMFRAHKVGDKVRIGLIHLTDNGKKFSIEIGVTVEPKPSNYGNAGNPQPLQPGESPGNYLPPAVTGAQAGGNRRQPSGGNLRLAGANTQQASLKKMGHCSALVPPGWTMRANGDGSIADLEGAKGMAHAAWGIRGVNTAMRAYYGDLYGPPELAVLATASAATQAQARFTGATSRAGGYFTARNFDAGQNVGTALYRVYSGPASGQYILSVFLAWADRDAAYLLPTAQAVMVSIDCKTALHPPPPVSVGRTGPDGRGNSGKPSNQEKDDLEGYNAQTGQQWAHSPTTGQSYLLDYATQWNEIGPEGPGYYRQVGNTTEKLENGW